MRLYVIGPVTGIEGDNRAAFEAARTRLLLSGRFREVRIPHDFIPEGTPWEEAMRISIARLVESDAVASLEGAADSRGARLEAHIACELGVEVRPVDDWLDRDGPRHSGGKWYAVTEIDGLRVSDACSGFTAIANLVHNGHRVKFKSFASEETARRYLETGCSYSAGHARGGLRTSVIGTKVNSRKRSYL